MIVAPDKAERVANVHRNTMQALADLVGAAGCEHPADLTPRHLMRRVNELKSVSADIAYRFVRPGALLWEPSDTDFADDWQMARADSFIPAE
ncbi:MAG: hypothetical protein ABWZ40_06215 [Caulobacterales bacterium]